jgi:hypothetical protein
LSRSVIRWENKKEEKIGFKGKRYGTGGSVWISVEEMRDIMVDGSTQRSA